MPLNVLLDSGQPMPLPDVQADDTRSLFWAGTFAIHGRRPLRTDSPALMHPLCLPVGKPIQPPARLFDLHTDRWQGLCPERLLHQRMQGGVQRLPNLCYPR